MGLGCRVDAGERFAELIGKGRWPRRSDVSGAGQARDEIPWPCEWRATGIAGQQPGYQAAEAIQSGKDLCLLAGRRIPGRELAKDDFESRTQP